jgi:Terminase large subunit, T4likevirus-type, N-terminal
MSRKNETLTRDDAIEQLWTQGVLDWKLSEPQKIIKKGILEDTTKISVVMCARRLGKTYLMLTMAIEKCLQKPNATVKLVFPKQRAAKKNVVPELKKILEDCPRYLKGEFKVADLEWQFPNGSRIQLSGGDGGNIENIRGGNSDLNIVDEAGFVDDLTYGVRSVLGPTVKLTGGRTILVSTPSRSENHEFIQNFVYPYMAEDRIKIFSIYDNPRFTDAILKDALDDYPAGENDEGFRREYMCEIVRSVDATILPSLTAAREKTIVTDCYPRPVYFTPYVGMDIGGTDLTAILFGYYDYLNAMLVIEDEIICDGTTNTDILAEQIREKEKLHWTNPIDKSQIQPFLRVSDNNNAILLTDLQKLHGLTFTKSKKDNKQAAINSLDVDLLREKIRIHPRCKTLIYHMRHAEWNNAGTDFKRLRDSSESANRVRGGHADALAAMIYLHRSVVRSYNPFPAGHGALQGSNVWSSNNSPQPSGQYSNNSASFSGLADMMKKMLKVKK